jgi:hypothetical protein
LRLLHLGLEVAREQGVRSLIVTAPVWAKTRGGADSFLASLPHADTIVLSYDVHHLEFITTEHYANAAAAARARGCQVAFNVCYSQEQERIELTESLRTLNPNLCELPENMSGATAISFHRKDTMRQLMRARGAGAAFVNFERILPVGNGTALASVLQEATRLETLEDFDRVKKSCNIGNVLVDTAGDLHACCWSMAIPSSPLQYPRAAEEGVRSAIRAMEEDARFRSYRQSGFVGSLSTDDKAAILEAKQGQAFVNECHLCQAVLARSGTAETGLVQIA